MGKNVFLLTVSLTLSVSLPGAGATWHVSQSVEDSGDGASWETAFKTIQEGIDASSDGDTVIVAEGTYVENIHFHGKNITLRSTDPLDPAIVAATIIGWNWSGPVVSFCGREDETCMLTGFTIQNGWYGVIGSSICDGTSGTPTRASIRNNIILGNRWKGIAFCEGVIERNTIVQNVNGLSVCNGIIRDNTISLNTGTGLANCMGLIYRNTVTLNSGGGLGECKGIILGNVIACNSSSFQGGGLRRCRGLIANNNIVHNAADLGGGLADCISDKDGEARIVNNTVYGNISRGGGGLYRCDRAVVTNCIIWGNTPAENQIEVGTQPLSAPEVVYSCIQGWTAGGEGNFSADPMFLDPDGPDDDPQTHIDNDYRLSLDSPCIDAGDNWVVTPGQMDADGNLRIAFGRYSLTVDIGAYELGSSPFEITQIAVVDGDRVLLTWNSQPGDVYTLWSSDDFLGASWTQERASPIPSQGGTTSCLVNISPSASVKIYRIEMK